MNTQVGVAWRAELSHFIAQGENEIAISEVLAENFWEHRHLPAALLNLRDSGVPVIPHAVSLSLGGARQPDDIKLHRLGALAEKLQAPYVSEHFAFTRAAGLESGHLLPFKRTQQTLEVVIENIRYAQERLPVPLCLENIATFFDWPDHEISEPQFIKTIIEETSIGLLLDVSNLYTNHINLGWSYTDYLDTIPLSAIAYVHIAGGCIIGKFQHDTHAHPLQQGPLSVLSDLAQRITLPAVLLEQDDNYQSIASVRSELDLIGQALRAPAIW
jgi:hypothetical protein